MLFVLISAKAQAVPPPFRSPVPLSCGRSPCDLLGPKRAERLALCVRDREDLQLSLFNALHLWAVEFLQAHKPVILHVTSLSPWYFLIGICHCKSCYRALEICRNLQTSCSSLARESCGDLKTRVSWIRKPVALEYKKTIGEELIQIYRLAVGTNVSDLSLFCTSLNTCIPCHWQFVLVLLNS